MRGGSDSVHSALCRTVSTVAGRVCPQDAVAVSDDVSGGALLVGGGLQV